MGMSAFYASAKTTTEADAKAVFHEAVAAGVTLFNSADFYGPLNAEGFGHNLRYHDILRKIPKYCEFDSLCSAVAFSV